MQTLPSPLDGEVEGELGSGLHAVGVDEDSGVRSLGDASEFGEGLDDACLVVGEHDGDELCVGLEGCF